VQLAQLNIAEALYGAEDGRMDGFTGRIDTINALADRAHGFIWRLVGASKVKATIPWSTCLFGAI